MYHLSFNCKLRFCMLGSGDKFGIEYFWAIEGVGLEVHKGIVLHYYCTYLKAKFN